MTTLPTRRGLLAAGLAAASSACIFVGSKRGGTSNSPSQRPPADDAAGTTASAPLASIGGARPGATPHTRFACNIEMWFRNLPFPQRVDAAADLGFPAVELWGLDGKDLPAIAARARARRVEIAQFTAWGFVPGLNDPANHDAFATAIERAVEAADVLGAKKATVVGGNDQPGMTQAQMHEHIRVGLSRVAGAAEAADLMLILEPMNIRVDHKGHCLYGSPEAVAICRAVGSSHVKLNWDLYHMQISEGDLTGRLKDGFDQLGYLQLADHPGRNEPGTGEIRYARVLRAAYELGYRGLVGLECWPRDGELTAARRVHKADMW
ncbi:MAG: hydroxypyruvate isomerase [Planctomycetota bacterium]|nr:MAG: hydroxypyruvate isomerase [Planctomycetota bacterium]